jgi:hypothetical protein
MTEESKLPDSIISAAERHKKIREESDRLEAEKDEQERIRLAREKKTDEKARDQEVKFLENLALVSHGETIEHLHERIRQLREPPPDPEKNRPPPFITERQRAQTAAEQEGGRMASERARIREETNRAAHARFEAEQAAKGVPPPPKEMEPLDIPNILAPNGVEPKAARFKLP